jgi:hexosaminidase
MFAHLFRISLNAWHLKFQWSEVFDHFKGKLNKQTIVHVWKDVTNVTEVVALGYDVLRNVGYDNISWYLDNLDVTWQGVYSNEPCSGIPDALCPRVLGGHGEMWGESVDASDVQATVWPKLAAIAEKLWSPAAFTNAPGFLKAAHPRLQRYRCMLLQRGVGAAPVDNANAREGPPSPGSCMQ